MVKSEVVTLNPPPHHPPSDWENGREPLAYLHLDSLAKELFPLELLLIGLQANPYVLTAGESPSAGIARPQTLGLLSKFQGHGKHH